MISAAEPREKKRVTVDGKAMAYVESGTGDPVVFLHGNPTSSYLWRNVMPHLGGLGRLVAPDLIGMGDSDKLEDSGPERYRFVEHRSYLDGFFAQLGITADVTLVVHDWGSALGFDWARRHPARSGARFLPDLAEPAGGHGQGHPLHPGRQPRRDRPGHRGLVADLTLRRPAKPCHKAD